MLWQVFAGKSVSDAGAKSCAAATKETKETKEEQQQQQQEQRETKKDVAPSLKRLRYFSR
jgi:hypothetical protein